MNGNLYLIERTTKKTYYVVESETLHGILYKLGYYVSQLL